MLCGGRKKYQKTWRLVSTQKKGNLAECSNWWGVILLMIISKLLPSIILERLKKNIDRKAEGSTVWISTRMILHGHYLCIKADY